MDDGKGKEIGPLMETLSGYIASALSRPLPAEVQAKAKIHALDTIAAMVSGSRLLPGEMAIKFARTQGGTPEAVVIGSDIVTTTINAALTNGMLAHADETDDSHKASRSHLGCGVVPAALAMAEKRHASGTDFLSSVALGYDIGARVSFALGVDSFYNAGHSTHSFAPLFGAAASAGALAGLNQQQTRWLLSYTAQQASGVSCWRRDREHVEKAFDFGGMPARNGVAAAEMVAAGFSGVDDVFSGPINFFQAFGQETDLDAMIAELGTRYELMQASIKKWSVGSPAQAPLDCIEMFMKDHRLAARDVENIRLVLAEAEAGVVDDKEMPDINVQHLISILLLDGSCNFASSHDYDRMRDPEVLAMKSRIAIEGSAAIQKRQAVVEINTTDGRKLSEKVTAVRGTPDNPMTLQEVEQKASELMDPVLGSKRSNLLIEMLRNFEEVTDVAEIREFLFT